MGHIDTDTVRTPADMLEAGAELIEEHGWYNSLRRRSGDETGFCMGLALSHVRDQVRESGASFTKAAELWSATIAVVEDHLGIDSDHLTGVYRWNDTHTKLEVIGAMRAAALAWREANE